LPQEVAQCAVGTKQDGQVGKAERQPHTLNEARDRAKTLTSLRTEKGVSATRPYQQHDTCDELLGIATKQGVVGITERSIIDINDADVVPTVMLLGEGEKFPNGIFVILTIDMNNPPAAHHLLLENEI